MKRMILSVIALCAFAQISHAYELDYSESEEIAAPRRPGFDDRRDDGRRDDRRDDDRRGGNNGPNRPGYPGNPGHGNPGGPGHGGPGHGAPRIEYVTCESQGNRYNTCYVDPYGIRNFYLAKQRSNTRCEQNRNFGLAGSHIWVDKGCRGVFAIERF
ncbi:DUF3011 domain-containing protein [Bdellovibrio sp. SKB1291214]|uniref:DUF3011 domain-containing protein n=1 Tax=Bdellovibrio sp. SKB1291214 TaxID=1732569 RepID=UPI000B51618F|nr:DUF3011 domain-containing protein [Bdellovibrio sp. SKB1291214]UYL07400.1 DUF3011 domain-containing protein [Bdellovibrio sp. SKB1291214]